MEQSPDSPPAILSVQGASTRGALVRLFILLALACGGLLLGIDAVFTPWAFYMGGHFHINPQWAGWGRMHSNLAGDYALYVSITPRTGGRGTYRNVPHIKGN